MLEHPIAARLAQITEQWIRFAESGEARMLVWQSVPQELAVIEAFVACESDEDTAKTDDVFLRLVSPFANARAHGYALGEELVRQYHEAARLFASAGIEPLWTCPRAREAEDDVQTFTRALSSLRAAHVANERAHLAVWLDPGEVRDVKAYLLWLQRLVLGAPAELRFIAVEARDDPAYAPLRKVEPMRVQAEACNLDMGAAVVALAERAGKDTPGGQFRLLLTQVGHALAAGDVAAAAPLAELAVKLAQAQGWPHLAAVVHMMRGGAHSALGQPLEAAMAYTEAERLGEACERQAEAVKAAASLAAKEPNDDARAAEPPPPDELSAYGRQLRLQARFGQGATMLAHGAWKQAAEVYLSAAPLAASLHDARAQLDCFRLASACCDRDGETEKAWDLGMRGFNVGLDMDEETRAVSTMPYLCAHLERFTAKHTVYRAHHEPLLEHFERLLGPDWRPASLDSGAPSS